MVYWLFLPLVFSIGLLVYVYAINPRERSNHLFALLMFCIALSAIALFVAATTDLEALAQGAILLRALLGFSFTGTLLFFLSVDLAWEKTSQPDWVRGYTMLVLFVGACAALVIAADHFGISRVFYGPIEYRPEMGYVYTEGRWGIGLELVRLVPIWGALSILIWRLFKVDTMWRGTLVPVLLVLLAMPAIRLLLRTIVRQPFPGIDLLAEFLLVLAFGYATSRHLFVPVEIIMSRLVDSMTDGVVVSSVNGQVLRVNDAAAQLLNVTEHQVKHRLPEALFTLWSAQVGSAALDLLREAIRTKPAQAYDRDFEIGSREGHQHIRLRVSPIHNLQDRIGGYLILLTDMTTIHHRQESLEQALASQRKLAAAMTEWSSPVLPVTEQIIVLPLMGNLDVKRTELTFGVLLNGVKTHRARIVIIDLTGIQHVSSDAAFVFAELLGAVRLLGAAPVLVGIQPPVAEALSNLDISALVVQKDLQAGLRYATRALKQKSFVDF